MYKILFICFLILFINKIKSSIEGFAIDDILVDTAENLFITNKGVLYYYYNSKLITLDLKNCDSYGNDTEECPLIRGSGISIRPTSFLLKYINDWEGKETFMIVGNGFVGLITKESLRDNNLNKLCQYPDDLNCQGVKMIILHKSSKDFGDSASYSNYPLIEIPTQISIFDTSVDTNSPFKKREYTFKYKICGIIPNYYKGIQYDSFPGGPLFGCMSPYNINSVECPNPSFGLIKTYSSTGGATAYNQLIQNLSLNTSFATSIVYSDGYFYYPNIIKSGLYERAVSISFPSYNGDKLSLTDCDKQTFVRFNTVKQNQQLVKEYKPTNENEGTGLFKVSNTQDPQEGGAFYYILPIKYDTYESSDDVAPIYFLVVKYEALQSRDPSISIRQGVRTNNMDVDFGFNETSDPRPFYTAPFVNYHFDFIYAQQGLYKTATESEIYLKMLKIKENNKKYFKYGFIVMHSSNAFCDQDIECINLKIGRVEIPFYNRSDLSSFSNYPPNVMWLGIHFNLGAAEHIELIAEPGESNSIDGTFGFLITSRENLFRKIEKDVKTKSVYIKLTNDSYGKTFFGSSDLLSENKKAKTGIDRGTPSCQDLNYWVDIINSYDYNKSGQIDNIFKNIKCNFENNSCSVRVTASNRNPPNKIILKNAKISRTITEGNGIKLQDDGNYKYLVLDLGDIASSLTEYPVEAHLYTANCKQTETGDIKYGITTKAVTIDYTPIVLIPYDTVHRGEFFNNRYTLAKNGLLTLKKETEIIEYILGVIISSLVIIIITFISIISVQLYRESKKTVKGIGKRLKTNMKKGNTLANKIGLNPLELEKISNNGVNTTSYLKKKGTTEIDIALPNNNKNDVGQKIQGMDIFKNSNETEAFSNMLGYY